MRKKAVNVERVFQRSIFIMVSAASLVLANAEEAPLPASLTPVIALLGYILVDRKRLIRLPVSAANLLGVIAFMAMAWEFSGNSLLGKLLSGAHLLVYITWVVLLIQKGIRQYWWLAALSVLQLAVASVLTTEGAFGASLVGMLLLMLWTLSVFTLYRGRIRVAQSIGAIEDSLNSEDSLSAAQDIDSPLTVRNGLQVDPEEPWIGWRFRSIVVFAFFASLTVAAVTFVVFPRVWMPGSPLAGISTSRKDALISQTGFTENVQLGEIGEIMQSDARVLQFEISEMKSEQSVSTERFCAAMRLDEILFRGNALGHYEKGRWSSGKNQGREIGDLAFRKDFTRDPAHSDLKIKITQDPPISTFAFAPAPANNAESQTPRTLIGRRHLTASLIFDRRERRNQRRNDDPVEFEVWCRAAPSGQTWHSPLPPRSMTTTFNNIFDQIRGSARESQQQRYAFSWCITRDLDRLLPQLSRLAKDVCTQDGKLVSDRESINRVFRYLNSSGRYQYSLNNTIQDPAIDPVEDFLINRRTGHCEYFASAGALMLQAVGVPARVINGYKGYEENSVSGRFEVKQKHAHTWIEAYVDGHWETLDPTPAAPREEGIAVSHQMVWWKDLTQTFNDAWRDFVEQMSPRRQEAMVRPLITSVKAKLAAIREQGVLESIKFFWMETVMHPSKWFSPTTGAVTFVVLLALGLVIQRNPLTWLKNKLGRWIRPGALQERSVVRFYENFREVCQKHGLPLPKNQTAQENADMARRHFATVLTTHDETALPARIATAFNRVRFGRTILSTEEIVALRNDVSRLGELLRLPVQA